MKKDLCRCGQIPAGLAQHLTRHRFHQRRGEGRGTLCSACGSNGVPKRGPPAESGTGEPLGPWPAPTAKQTAQLPRSTFRPSQSPQPRACSAWTSPWLSKELPHQVSMRLWFAGTPQRAPQCDVHHKLGPTKHGRSWAKTSMRRSSLAGTHTFMSLRNALHLTRAPASLQIRANMRSVGVARFLSRPILGQAARCPFRSSSWHPLHRASVTGSGRASRSSNNTRKMWRNNVNASIVPPNATSSEHGAKRDGQSTLRSSCNVCQRQRMPNIANRAAIRLGHERRSEAVASRREVPPNWVATRSPCVPTRLPLL